MVSHQFRTPLAILDSSAQRILRRGETQAHDELVERGSENPKRHEVGLPVSSKAS